MQRNVLTIVCLGAFAVLVVLLFPFWIWTERNSGATSKICGTVSEKSGYAFVFVRPVPDAQIDVSASMYSLSGVALLTFGAVVFCRGRKKDKEAVEYWRAKWERVDDSENMLLRPSNGSAMPPEFLLRATAAASPLPAEELLRASGRAE